MHALVIRVSINDREAAESTLNEQVVPTVSQAPGFVAGSWTNVGGDQGRAMIVFESADASQAVEQRIREAVTEAVSLDSIEVAEVIAHA